MRDMSMAINVASNVTISEYRADTLGIISTLLHGYSGGITIVREMAQNADDVPGEGERWLEFHFNDDTLIIRNNTRFRQIDFENITNIARGGKKLEQRNTIGMFGVGFVSVYQLTDTPSIRSSGQTYSFAPEKGQVYIADSDVVDYTEFHLPYRRNRTRTGDALGMPAVTDLALKDIQDALGDEAYRLLFFLRRLSKITMYRNRTLICSVERSITPSVGPEEPDEIVLTRTQGQTTERHRWLRYSGNVRMAAPRRDDGSAAKDKAVHIVIPDADIPNAIWQDLVPGRLYNYLPTEIETGLPFQINGDFYPSTDRKHIDQDHANHRDWNTWVLKGLGECLATALPSLLRRFAGDPLKLYQRLPINKSGNSLVQPIADRFFEAATKLPIFYANNEWRIAASICWAKAELHSIAKQVDLRLMDSVLQTAAWGLIQRSGVKEYTLSDFLKRVNIEVARGSKLAEGPSYMQNRDQLTVIYTMLEKDFAREYQHEIASSVLFVDQADRVWAAKDCVRTDLSSVRDTLRDSGIHFWDEPTARYPRLSASVPEFKLVHLWTALRNQIKQQIPLDNAPVWMNSRQKLYALYRTILDTREQVARGDVQGIYLCLNRAEELCTADSVFMPANEPRIYELFADDPDSPLVLRTIMEDRKHRPLYEDLGVRQFDWEMVLKRLEKLIRFETELELAHPIMNSRDKAVRMYRYLSSHRESFVAKHSELLRHRLPLWLGRDGRLHFAKDLTLPASNSDWPATIRIDSVLDIRSNENLDPFFTEVLEIKRLDTARFIIQYVLPQYAALTRLEQSAILQFLRKESDLLRATPDLLRAVQATPLIYGDDDQLHRAGELCFPRTRLRNIFPNTFHLPHATYTASTENTTTWVWGPFFELLGVHHVAPPEVVLKEVQRLTGPGMLPRHNREAIETLFWYLAEKWTPYYAGKLQKLSDLRWLPAADDDQNWHKPRDLYQRTQGPLVSEVAHILGFSDATRPRKDIADGLGFPTAPERVLVVKQLLKLQAANRAPSEEIYRYLINATEQDLKPLLNQPIIWDKQRERYWNANHIFLDNHKNEFGAYRGYVTSGDIRSLLERLGSRTNPTDQDYCDLIMQIADRYRTQAVPQEEIRLLINAYSRLSNADPLRLEKLKGTSCILSRIGDEYPRLCLPSHALLQPPERFVQMFPNIPLAIYNADSEATLRHLGVQALDQVLNVEFRLQPALAHPFNWLQKISVLERPLKRLFHHYGLLARAEPTLNGFKDIKAYYEESIQVTYHIRLGGEQLSSSIVNERAYYAQDRKHIYIQAHLDDRNARKALARALHQVLGLPTVLILLEALLEDPHNWREILDDNDVKPLPPQFDFEDLPQTIDDLQLGEESDTWLDSNDSVPHVPSMHGMDTSTASDQTKSREDTSKERATPDVLPRQHNGVNTPVKPAGTTASSRQNLGTTAGSRQNPAQKQPDSSARSGMQPGPAAAPTKSPPNGRTSSAGAPLNIPDFHGRSTLSSPSIQTDLDGLRDRVRSHFAAQGMSFDAAQTSNVLPPQPRREPTLPSEPLEAHTARFILSFAEVSQGFLRLHTKARNLFLHNPVTVHCSTDFGHAFVLYFNWNRSTAIAYNQTALTTFFAEQNIPAGGIVYLERLHGDDYRLYYNRTPHTVREVRIAINEQGTVTYETIHEVEVVCETDEAIYRAEKRHEDQGALWLEAVGKKSIEETLCDLLLAAPDGWLHEDDLKAIVQAERMVAASTVEQTLRQQPWFSTDGQGSWRLDPGAVLSSQNDIAQRWSKLSHKLIASPDSVLLASLESLLSLLPPIRQRLLALEMQSRPSAVTDQAEDMISTLNADPYNALAANALEQSLHHRIQDPDTEILTDASLRQWFSAASPDVWHHVLRSLLLKELQFLRRNYRYEAVAHLAHCWADFDSNHGLVIEELTNEAQAWSSTRGKSSIPALVDAILLAPNLSKLREELHIALQATLQHYTAQYWLQQNTTEEHAIIAFFEHIRRYEAARACLAREHQTAYDRTIQLQAKHLREQLGAAQNRVLLALELATTTKQPLADVHLKDLTTYVSRADTASIEMLLLASRAWTLCASTDYLRRDIANTLARCYIHHRIWELANNQPWKPVLSDDLKQQLHKGWEQHRSSQLSREQEFVNLLSETELSGFGNLLKQELASFQLRVQRDIQQLIASSAG